MFALGARALGLTPTQVTVASGLAGVVGGGLLYDQRFGSIGFAFLILYSILDAADGQLARLTNSASDFGRLVDGIAGYAAHAAIYVGIVAGFIARGGSRMIAWWATASALSNVVHAQLYDYHRTSYTKLAINGTVSRDVPGGLAATWAGRVLRIYHAVQRRLI